MAATGDNAALPGGLPRPGETDIDTRAAPLTEFGEALGLYALWMALTGLSVLAGQTTLAAHAAAVLVTGIGATNALFLMIAKSGVGHRPPASTTTLAQSVMAITWTTLFAFMSAGSGELALGMYVSTILYAVRRVGRGALSQLAVFAAASYAIVVAVKMLLTGSPQPVWADAVTVLVFAGIIGVAGIYGCRGSRDGPARAPAAEVHSGGEPAAMRPARDDVEPDANDRRSVLESLAREKGRTDRSPGPLSVCIFEIDGFDGLTRKHGRAAVGLIQQRLGKRIRGELRAMDGVTPGGARRSFDRTGEERYVALLPQTNLSGAARCAERIRAAIAKYPIDGRYAITVSAGIVEYRRGESAAVLLGRAEAAVSRALEAAGNCIVGSAEGDAVPHADVIPMRGLRS